jgi:hypothetical protein
VIDGEPGGLAQALRVQALRAEARPVAVPGHNEQIRLRRGRHHGPFGPPCDLEPLAGRPSRSAAAASNSPADVAAISSGRVPGSCPPRPGRPAWAPWAAPGNSAGGRCSKVKRAPAGARFRAGSMVARHVPSQTQTYTERTWVPVLVTGGQVHAAVATLLEGSPPRFSSSRLGPLSEHDVLRPLAWTEPTRWPRSHPVSST